MDQRTPPVRSRQLSPGAGEHSDDTTRGEIAAGQGGCDTGLRGYAEKGREEGKERWRAVGGDGAVVFDVKTFHGSLTMSYEGKKKLPDEGERVLFVRAEMKKVV